MIWFLYILECKDNSFYTGITTNIGNRLLVHGNGKGAKYTRGRGPFKLRYIEEFADKSSASIREVAIKKLKRKEKQKLFIKD